MPSRAIHLAVPVLLLASLCMSSWRTLAGIYSPMDSLQGFAVLLAVVTAVFWAIRPFMRSWRHAVILVSAVIAWMISPALFALVVVIAGVERLAEKRLTGQRTLTVMAIVSVAVFAMTAWPVAIGFFGDHKAQDVRNRIGDVAPLLRTPSIYHFVLDGYGDPDVLASEIGHDAAPFIAALQDRGFKTFRHVGTAFNQTLPSIASTMNGGVAMPMDSMQNTTEFRQALARAFQDSDVLNVFRASEYEIAYAPSGYAYFDIGDARRLSRLSFLPPDTATYPVFGLNAIMARTHRQRLDNALDSESLGTLRQPFYYFQHLLAPHPPFVVKRDGEARADLPFMLDGSHYTFGREERRALYRAGYREKALYVERRLIEQIDALPPGEKIVIIHGDHGPGTHMDHEDPAASCASERMLTFAAIYSDVPEVLDALDAGGGLRYLPNIFRRILFGLTGQDLPDLPAEQFFLTWSTPDAPVPVPLTALDAPCG